MRTTCTLCQRRPMAQNLESRFVRRAARRLALVIGLALPLVFAFVAVAKDTTRPIVKFQIRQGQEINTVKTATMTSGEPLTIRAEVKDPQGVKSLTVSFPPA